MKRKTLLIVAAAAACCASSLNTFAQTTPGSILYTPNVDLAAGAQNTFAGTVGGIFLPTYSFYPQVNWLGYYDENGNGLANSHLVTLWDNSSQTILASATVPAGTAAPLINGYRWVQLSSTVQLNYGSYYVIAAQTDGVDLWGDMIANNSPDNGNNGQISWNSDYVQLGSGWEFTRAGRYDFSGNYPAEPPNQVGSDAIYPVANLGYNLTPVPEPASVALLGLSAAVFVISKRRRSR
jgi:PEP-CTERM motif